MEQEAATLVIWGPNDPRPSPPIFIPIIPPPVEGGGPRPEHPIYIPVYPEQPEYLDPVASDLRLSGAGGAGRAFPG